MGTYGTYTGIIRWYDKVNRKGHLLALQDGEVQSDMTADSWSSGATAYDEGVGWWFERPPVHNYEGSPMGMLLALTYPADATAPGTPRIFIGNADGSKLLWDGNDLIITGTIYATAGEFTGTVNWGGGRGVLNTTGLAWEVGADDYVAVDTSDPGVGSTAYLKVVSNTAGNNPILAWNKYDEDTLSSDSQYAMYAYHSGSNGTALYADGCRRGVQGRASPDAGTDSPSVGVLGTAGDYGVASSVLGFTSNYSAHFEMKLAVSAGAVVRLLAGHIQNLFFSDATSRESAGNFIEFAGQSEASSPLTRNMVKESDVTTATRAGWVRVRLNDGNSRITTGNYYLPVYTLA